MYDDPIYLVNDCAIDDHDIDESLSVSKLTIT